MGHQEGDFTHTLDLLGLTPMEAAVYLSILRRGTAKSSDIISELKIHQPQLYNIILSLTRKGFVRASGSRPKLYVPVDPSTVFEAAIRELRSGEKKLSSLYRNPASAGDGSKPIAWFVKGRRNTVSTLQSIIEEASAEILMEQPLSLLSSTLGRLATKSKRGVEVYLLLYGGEPTDAVKRRLVESGVSEVRFTGLGHYLLCVTDQATCLYAPRKLFSGIVLDANESNTLVFREKEVADFFNHNFFVAWFKAKELFSEERSYNKKVYTNQRAALYVLSKILRRGVRPRIRVEGRNTRTGKPIQLEGKVLDTRIEEEVYSFTLDTGKALVEVGGENALVETVIAERVEILEGG